MPNLCLGNYISSLDHSSTETIAATFPHKYLLFFKLCSSFEYVDITPILQIHSISIPFSTMATPHISNGAVEDILRAPSHVTKITGVKSKSRQNSTHHIIDIRHDGAEIELKDEILASLRPQSGLKSLPTLLLYDERGLQIYEEITYLPEYYLTNAEIDVLERSAENIAASIPSNSMVVELGSGNLRKVSILLRALDAAGKNVDYYALDLSLRELERTLEQVPEFKHVKCHGLHGTYDDGLAWLKLLENSSRPKCVLSMGSSIGLSSEPMLPAINLPCAGNFQRHDASSFLKSFAEVLSPSDMFLIAIDATSNPEKIYHAYNDEKGVTHRFILNGLVQANRILGENVFDVKDWTVIGEYVYGTEGGRHQAFYSPNRDIVVRDVLIKAGERVKIEVSLKYSPEETANLLKAAGMREAQKWSASSDEYNIHLLTKSTMAFDTNPKVYASSTAPTLEDWKGLWSVWDTVTRKMIPDEELVEKPINLRNACIFYLGHIPTFLDLQLNKVTKEALCEPSSYLAIFERGIDPDVDNPEQCHAHSEIPEEWPPLEEILSYQEKVREKVQRLYASQNIPRSLGRALWVGFEHEAMHLETLLYMLLQSDKTIPPTTASPNFKEEARLAKLSRVPNEWFTIPEQEITIGLDDPEDNSGPDSHFGWDNEKPSRKVVVQSFQAKGRPITNEEYARYLEQTHEAKIPASWAQHQKANGYTNGNSNGHSNGITNGLDSAPLTKGYLEDKAVRTVYGLVPLEYALDWPVFASYDELSSCATWMGGRIPTVEEVRSIYSHADGLNVKKAERHLGKTVPAVNGHLINEGVEETPPSQTFQNGAGSQELFTDLEGANVAFKNWHPISVTARGNRLAGQADMGGVWEWTSSPLSAHEGFEPMALYPAYTADFFDGKHNIVLGGSWATHPRIAGRKTFVNWYQRNYPYTWAGARLVRDL
ncbi:hypothetical protein EYC80_001682 [Monilinia laxa]|uniref:Sulfatase-modifying factor enzyme domain-containing protein n=2 Tax=Monilinia laxa TaxID=61186 RepID=A0A5N6K5T4_MONLA|nr:hypothetical protein EYC80_001682 [Monilinia laxa]